MRVFIILTVAFGVASARAAAPVRALPIAEIHRTDRVQFESEILPFLKESCLACHNDAKPKAGLSLETPQSILKGGDSGPAVVPGQPGGSLLLDVASHRQEPVMPPSGNKVNAPDLNPHQLALLKLWIEQGASGEVSAGPSIVWRGLPEKVRPILSLAITDDAQFAACGRGNHLAIYQLPTGRTLPALVDPSLHQFSSAKSDMAAHLDLVQALDFSPDGELLASGSYREVKLWRRQHPIASSLSDLGSLASPGETNVLVSVSPRGDKLALVSSATKLLRVRNIAGDDSPHTREFENVPQALTWVADGNRFVSATGMNIEVWTSELMPVKVLTNAAAIAFLCSAGTQLVVGDSEGIVRFWNVDSGEQVQSFTNQNPMLALAVSPDTKTLAIADPDQTVRLWSMDERKLLKELRGDYGATYRLNQRKRAVSHATAHMAYRATVVEKSEKERQTQVERVRKASEVAGTAQKSLLDSQGQLSAAKAEEATVEKDLATLRAQLKAAQDGADSAGAELLKAKTAFPASGQDALESRLDELVALAAKSALASNSLAGLKPEAEKNEKAASEKLKAAQKRISDSDAAIKRWQLTNSASENELHFAITAAQNALQEATLAQNEKQTSESTVKQSESLLQAARVDLTNAFDSTRLLAFSADGKTLATVGAQGSVTLWGSETGAPLETLAPSPETLAISFTENGALLSLGAAESRVWDVSPPWKLERVIASAAGLPAFSDRVNAVRFSPDGQHLATAGGEPSRNGEVKIWRVKDGQLVNDFKTLHSDAVLAMAYSPDGRYLATGASDRFAKVVEAATGNVVRVLEGHTHHILSVSWKSDGHTLMTAGADNMVKVWDALSGERKKNIEGFGREVTAVAYLGETDQALASSGDASLRIVKEDGEKVRSLDGARDYLQAALPSSDGLVVLAGGQDGILRIWDAQSGKLMSEIP